MRRMRNLFRHFSHWVSNAAGAPLTFVFAVIIILVWAITGPLFNFSTTWQLIINTGTTIVTFLMVFLIQNTQNRDSHAVHLKLDEILRALQEARDDLIDIEDDSDEKIDALTKEFDEFRKKRAAPPQV